MEGSFFVFTNALIAPVTLLFSNKKKLNIAILPTERRLEEVGLQYVKKKKLKNRKMKKLPIKEMLSRNFFRIPAIQSLRRTLRRLCRIFVCTYCILLNKSFALFINVEGFTLRCDIFFQTGE